MMAWIALVAAKTDGTIDFDWKIQADWLLSAKRTVRETNPKDWVWAR